LKILDHMVIKIIGFAVVKELKIHSYILKFIGYLIDGALPDGRWWRFLLASVVNLINIGVCLIGAAAFARMSAFILAVVVVCLSVVIVSYMAQPPMDVSNFNV
jgi:hypothetical protein